MKTFAKLITVLWITTLTACNFSTVPSPGPFPIPNQTMTALFSTPLPTLMLTSSVRPDTATPGAPTAPPSPTRSPVFTATITASPTEPAPTQTPTPPAPTEPAPTEPVPTQAPPTATAWPSATADISHRTVTSVTARFMAANPTIDGDWNDFPDKEYPAEIVVYGVPAWKGRDDLAASFRIGWDTTNLYLAVKVRDEHYVQNATGAALFKGDSLEILLDTQVANDFYYRPLSPDDFQLGIAAGRPTIDGTREAYLWLPANLAGARSQVNIAAMRNEAEGITRIEVAIPWSVFAVKPKAGMHFGFALSASDNDNPDQNVQQKMVSNVKTRVLTDPTTWGDLTLGN